MSETALTALYRALNNRLSSGGSVWADRVYADQAPDGTAYPYAVYFWAGGGETNRTRTRDAEFVITVQSVSDDLATALVGAQQIADLLNDHGEFDHSTDYLNGGTYWRILTVTEETTIHAPYSFSDVLLIYHDGAQYRIVMEAK